MRSHQTGVSAEPSRQAQERDFAPPLLIKRWYRGAKKSSTIHLPAHQPFSIYMFNQKYQMYKESCSLRYARTDTLLLIFSAHSLHPVLHPLIFVELNRLIDVHIGKLATPGTSFPTILPT